MSRFNTRTAVAALVAAVSLTVVSCSGAQEQASDATDTTAAQAENTVTVEDNYGVKEVPSPAQRVVALDNRSFELLDTWGIEPVAAARALVPVTIPGIGDNDNIVDIGNHREPNLEAIVAAEPDVIVSGQRFQTHDADIEKLVPDAILVDFEPRDGEPFDAELIRHTESLGEIFGKQEEAAQLVDDFQNALERAKAAYNPEQTVMAVNISGGEIGYVAPGVGRTWGPLFDLIGMKPALEVQNATDDHQGDDISVEAIASANPDWMLILDRDAGTRDDEGSPAALSVIEDSAPLQNVTAVKEGQLYVAPADTYTNESIITYTEILNDIADQFEAAK
ncbi:ABC transporter substrate-binding protein [Corynebacterium sanguinis]|uniref:siderophore ABC transporter substrate-binding protein n=1 Tax=Corynebacterium TaxID=1716 RepID=UPI0002E04957|nr:MULTISPECIES: ABC transporter substrate-binding protein [Corynebacterium]MCT1554762.1 ABC transporter substrate-binding protein [Corynebacterium sanguinis]MCT1585777.1 ABC transporter substrate-binding protein [Corynebacterium sanguinis]MCT1805237.1 ABC transporter substrate-binding protein [Corynebacterium sanguinis]MCT2024018.1 ABC transporter substrate-binding protein [Corynebacterium sanguinis]MCT2047998.1 ABC transporter substrate-binding protein [Corynebacterium sanguinis]